MPVPPEMDIACMTLNPKKRRPVVDFAFLELTEQKRFDLNFQMEPQFGTFQEDRLVFGVKLLMPTLEK